MSTAAVERFFSLLCTRRRYILGSVACQFASGGYMGEKFGWQSAALFCLVLAERNCLEGQVREVHSPPTYSTGELDHSPKSLFRSV